MESFWESFEEATKQTADKHEAVININIGQRPLNERERAERRQTRTMMMLKWRERESVYIFIQYHKSFHVVKLSFFILLFCFFQECQKINKQTKYN